MDWDKLRIFHAVADAGSFTHAGETLHLSQSAVSRQISSLEDSLSVRLFHRHARGLILTEQGELLYRTVHDVFAKLTMVEARLSDSHEQPKGPLKIATTVGLGSLWLTPRIKEFIELFPDIEVTLVTSDEELDVSMREADCVIRLTPPTQGDLIQRRLTRVHTHVFASPAYLQNKGMPEKVRDLANLAVIVAGDHQPCVFEAPRHAGFPLYFLRPSALRWRTTRSWVPARARSSRRMNWAREKGFSSAVPWISTMPPRSVSTKFESAWAFESSG